MRKQTPEELFQEQMFPHLDTLYRAAYSMTRNSQDADDLVQDTFVRAFQFIDKFHVGTNARAWLFRIMTNLFINRYRRAKREPEKTSFDEIEDFYLYNRLQDAYLSRTSESPEAAVMGKVQAEAIQDAISRLPDEYRDTVIMADLNELSYLEISEILEVPIGTVRSRLSRGRRLVQRAIWAFTEENPR
ncbi:sigma-70 family RNA polymerase sigma factor [Armatimonas sp.]|uniref:sigma-70 family RNA polymerase sigma factor n=1 Tax=Armatimonas sp. TaxID=1872638 RepID=UPI00374FEC6C